MLYKGLNSFLLLKVEAEQRVTDFAQLFTGTSQDLGEIVPVEESTGGQRRNEGVAAGAAVERQPPSPFFPYMVSEMPSVLWCPICRRDDHDRFTAVGRICFLTA